MLKRTLSGIMLTLLLINLLNFGFVFRPVQAENPLDGKLSTEVPSTAFEEDPSYDVVNQKISITYNFLEPKIEEKCVFLFRRSSDRYVSVTMDGLRQCTQVGLPVLPFKTIKILLPFTTEFQHVKAIGGQKTAIVGSYLVEYGGQPVPLTAVESADACKANLPNETVYSSSKPFPERLYSDVFVQNKMGYKILVLNLHPVEYVPNIGKLYYYESIRVEVEVAPQSTDEPTGFHGYPQRCEIVESMVDNREVIETYPTPKQTPAFQYVIITNEQLNNTAGPYNFQALRDEKISRNITATIVTTEWIYANYSGTRPDGGTDDQTRIRNFIVDAYNNWGTLYVLLGGDGDGGYVGGECGDVIIPHRGFASGMDDDIPADMYYGCLDGTFDYDCDGIYAEPNDGLGGGEVDLFAEVYVGRACVDSQTEVQNFVRKTLSYQNTTGEDLRKVWMVGEYLGFGGVAEWGGNYKDEIKEGSNVHGYTTVGFENTSYSNRFDVFTLYDRDDPVHDWNKTGIIDVINSNVHLINHLGHANVDYVMKMTNPDVDGLTNNQSYFIGYSQGCYCGSFDDRTTSPGYYTDYDCISEHFTTEAHGAVAFISNSRYGWGIFESTDGPSQHYDREFWDAVLGEEIFNLGIANQDSKEDNAGRVGDWVERYCYYEINLFGDPELQIKVPPAYQHDLQVTLDAPDYLEPDSSSLLNGTVWNRGLNNETNVELYILINGTEVANATIPKLVNGTSHTVSYTWTPTVEAVYNVTAYAQPVPDENATWNNKYTEFVSVYYPLINPQPGQYANYVVNIYDISGYLIDTGYWNFTYDHYVEPHKINITLWSIDSSGYISTGWMIVNTMNRLVESGVWAGLWYPGWIETDIDIGSTINLLYGTATVNGSRIMMSGPRVIDCWELPYSEYEYQYTFGYDKMSGLWIRMKVIDPYYGSQELLLVDTNIPIGTQYQHDLGVTLDTPQRLQPDETSLLNATIYNLGLNNETNVELQLFINGTQVANKAFAKLVNGTWRTINYSWTPTTEGIYNITAYASPVLNENVTANNIVTKMVNVRRVKGYILFDQTHWTDSITYYSAWVANLTERGYIVDTLTTSPIAPSMLEGYDVFVIPQAHDYYSSTELSAIQDFVLNGGGLLVIGDDDPYIYTDLTSFAGITWISGGYSGYTNDITLHLVTEGINTAYFSSPMSNMYVTSPAVDLIRDYYNYIMLAVSEIGPGKVIGIGDENTIDNYDISYADNFRLANNMIDWLVVKYEHELTVRLDAPSKLEPGDTSLLNATVCNNGLNNETNVELQLFINGTQVANKAFAKLVNGTWRTINYSWTPTTEGIYNITAYASPVPDENVTINNIATQMVYVGYAEVALISDYSELLVITSILDSMGIDYDIYNDNYYNLYTEDLDLLLNYTAVIFYTGSRWITSTEYSTLESYLSSGGNLLVTGFDCLVSDALLADLVRSSSTGDNVGESDLYVVDETHPIMDGPYGSFPAGYHIYGLFSDCDMVEADTTRNAVTVAELYDGYDRIIATEGLPGKVVFWNGMAMYDWTWDTNCEAMFKNLIDWFMVRYERELVVYLEAPNFLEPGDLSLLNATVLNRGLSNESGVELFLLINDTVVNSTTIPELVNGMSNTIDYLWTPTVEGVYNITAYASPVPDENITANNWYTKFVRARYAVMIGIIETHGETLHSEDLANYYTSLGHIVEKITTTITPGVLDNYDIVIVGEDSPWLPSEIAAVEAFIDSGGGFVAIGDELATSVQEILHTYGVSYTGISAPGGSSSNFDPLHPIMQGVSLIYAPSPVDSLAFVAPAYWIANDASDTYTLIAGAEVGGHVLCLSDDFTGYSSELYEYDNEIMFENILDWMTVEYVPPEITVLSPENKTYTITSIPLTFTVDEPTSWIGYSLDNHANETIPGNTTLTALSEGTHTIVVYANDTSGNMGASETVYFTVDTTSPTISILSPENKTYAQTDVSLTFTVNETASWIGYSLDGQANMTITENKTLTGLDDGSHCVVVYVNDTAGNMDSSDIIYFTVDTTPPNITDVSQIPEDIVLPGDEVKVNATVTDYLSEVTQVTLNFTNGNGTWITIDMTPLEINVWNATIPPFEYCTYVNYTIIAEDSVGNTVTTEELEYELQYHVIPEFPPVLVTPLLMIATLLMVIVYKRKHSM